MVRWYEKKKQKSVDSALHQAMKAIAKVVKVVRGLLVAKYVRKLKQLEDNGADNQDDNAVAVCLKKIEDLKTIHHSELAERIVIRKLFPVARRPLPDQDDNTNGGSDDVNSMIINHSTISEAIEKWTTHVKSAVRDEAIAKRDAELAELKRKKQEERDKEGAVHRKRSFDTVTYFTYCLHLLVT